MAILVAMDGCTFPPPLSSTPPPSPRYHDASHMSEDIREMRRVQQEQNALLHNLLQQGPKDQAHMEHVLRDIRQITHLEMEALLGPIKQSLRNMQSKLAEFPQAPSMEKEAHAPVSPAQVVEKGVHASALPAPVVAQQAHAQASPASVLEQEAHTLACPLNLNDYHGGSTVHGSKSKPDDCVPEVEDQSPNYPESTKAEVEDQSPNYPESTTHVLKKHDSLTPTNYRRPSLGEYFNAEGGLKESDCDTSDKKVKVKVIDDYIENQKIQRLLSGHGVKERAEYIAHDEMVHVMEGWLQKWNSIKSPKFDNCIYRFVKGRFFQSVCMLAIFSNTVLIAITEDWQIRHIGHDEPQIFGVLEVIFTIFFLAELIIRLAAHRIYFFINDEMLWNIFDLALVAVSVVDVAFEHVVGDQATESNVSFMRLLRLFKLARLLRSLRTFHFFKELNNMLSSLRQAFTSLFWGLVLLMFVLWMFSLIYLQALINHVNQDSKYVDAGVMQLVETRASSLPDVIISLYMSVTGGLEWSPLYDAMWKIGPTYALLFLIFTFFFFFAVFNILTAVVVEKAMEAARPDRTDQTLQQRKELKDTRQELIRICKAIDSGDSGKITKQDFVNWGRHSVNHFWMESVGLDISDVELFFELFSQHADGTGLNEGEVTIQNFVDMCLHMRGVATAQAVQKQIHITAILFHNFQLFDRTVSLRLSGIEKALAHCLPSMTAVWNERTSIPIAEGSYHEKQHWS